MLKAVIFDIDGTLIDSVDLHAESWVRALAHFGVSARLDDVRGHIGEGADRLMPAFLPPDTPQSRKQEIEDYRSKLFQREYLGKVRPFPKVRELFELIKRDGRKLVLASSCTADEITQYKRIAGIADMVDCQTTSDDARRSKPAPDIFVKAVQSLSPIGCEDCVVVGDSRYDGEAALKAGIAFVAVLCGGSPEPELKQAGAVAIYKDPEDLLLNWNTWKHLPSCQGLSAAAS
ncbi:MAG: hypothetical protein QOI12_723 [Alphaproteobacteria bacterium]|nr:hypothetical protein [Alphaproteobacteria bacterium]